MPSTLSRRCRRMNHALLRAAASDATLNLSEIDARARFVDEIDERSRWLAD